MTLAELSQAEFRRLPMLCQCRCDHESTGQTCALSLSMICRRCAATIGSFEKEGVHMGNDQGQRWLLNRGIFYTMSEPGTASSQLVN
ncbi:unnamed protein product [Gongylonema pulchrum]|uniref:Zn_Tnp_IS91 domain-containing protein n=1 Tax=Gongylonema pulchrum TaxID=637853 RepID=A0A183EWV9_9BILA|nr:unnamed protein product [Gongylonema pulchrum]